MTAERNGFLGDAQTHQSLVLILGQEEPDDFDEETDFDEEDFQPPGRRSNVVAGRKPKASARPAPAWVRVLNQIKHSTDRGGAQDRADLHAWAETRQLVFVIDAPASAAKKQLIVDLGLRERKIDGDWGKPKIQAVTQQQAEQIRTEPDAAIVRLLFGRRSRMRMVTARVMRMRTPRRGSSWRPDNANRFCRCSGRAAGCSPGSDRRRTSSPRSNGTMAPPGSFGSRSQAKSAASIIK